MEHLLMPHDADFNAVPRIPYVCYTSYDGGPFLDYPLRLPVPIHALHPQHIGDTEQAIHVIDQIAGAELESLMHTWLLFGLLHEIMGPKLTALAVEVMPDEANPDQHYISTRRLYEVLRTWLFGALSEKSEEAQQRLRYQTYMTCIRHTYDICKVLAFREAGMFVGKPRIGFNSLLLYSIASVAEALSLALERAFGSVAEPSDKLAWGVFFIDATTNNKMRSNRWCASEMGRIQREMPGFAELYYCSQMGRISTENNHSLCDDRKCLELQNDLENYQIRHCTDSCGPDCTMINVDVEQLHAIFERGSFPVVRFVEGEVVEIEILSASPGTAYVAMSHLWADGFGNPISNAMPACQLVYLRQITRDLKQQLIDSSSIDAGTDLCVFIDTLLVPTTPQDPEGLAKKAIALAMLREIYQKANCVLVLDRSILAYKSITLDADEALMRLCTSPWSSRLWTLQEGVLARSLWLQFQDHAVNFDKLKQSAFSGTNKFRKRYAIAHFLVGAIVRLREFWQWDETTLTLLSMRLWGCQCSVVTDEAICLTTLLDLDTNTIAAALPDQRMQYMWKNFDHSLAGIPSQIIFHMGPRINSPGFRWAPSSLLRSSGSPLWMEKDIVNVSKSKGRIAPNGLKVKKPGFSIYSASARRNYPGALKFVSSQAKSDMTYCRDSEGLWYFVQVEYRMGGESATLTELLQRSAPQAIVLEVNETSDVRHPVHGNIAHGIYGPYEETNIGSGYFIKTELILTLRLMGSTEQTLLAAAYKLVDDELESSGRLPLSAVGVKGYAGTDVEAQGLQFLIDVKALAAQGLAADAELRSIVNSHSKGVLRLEEYVVRVLAGGYGILCEEFPGNQLWIVD